MNKGRCPAHNRRQHDGPVSNQACPGESPRAQPIVAASGTSGPRPLTASLKAQFVFGQSRHRGRTKFGRGRLGLTMSYFKGVTCP